MKIQFELENDCYYAVADNVIYNDQLVDSLWYAEIEPGRRNYIVRWDENYSNKIEFNTLQEAKEYILREYSMHTPQIVGKRYDIY